TIPGASSDGTSMRTCFIVGNVFRLKTTRYGRPPLGMLTQSRSDCACPPYKIPRRHISADCEDSRSRLSIEAESRAPNEPTRKCACWCPRSSQQLRRVVCRGAKAELQMPLGVLRPVSKYRWHSSLLRASATA